ncbi:alkaline phosphatase [Caldithrix abyssi]
MLRFNFKFFALALLTLMVLISCKQEARQPKNIIVFIADGCGFNQVAAGEYYQFGEKGKAVYQSFPIKFAMSTFPVDGLYEPQKAWKSFAYVLQKPTDSAASATALATGVKTKNGILGMDSTFTPLQNIVEVVEQAGKATGVVTTVPFNHATPAGFVAHNESRKNYHQIAREMIFKSTIDLIMGAGHPEYDDNAQKLQEPVFKFISDSAFQELKQGKIGNDADGDGAVEYWTFIEDSADFAGLVSGQTPERVFGLAKVISTLQFNRAGDKSADAFTVPFNKGLPDLRTMTQAAINVLDDDPDGFFLMVEGGAIDWAGHANAPGRLIEEKLDFDKAVQAAIEWVEKNSNWDETLIIVTGDHETGYLTGPGAKTEYDGSTAFSVEEVWPALKNNGKGKMPDMEFHSHGHTNSLIPFFAKGQGSGLFKGEVDGTDPVRGKFIDNSDVGKVLKSFFNK